MKATWIRLAAFAAGIAVLASCDTRLPTTARAGSSSTSSLGTAPLVGIDSPLVGALINVGDSVFVRVHLHDTRGVAGLSVGALTITGSKDLGTYTETPRYTPASVTFRPKLVDTTIRRYLKPLNAADTTLDSLIVFAIGTDSLGAADTARVTVNLVSGPTVTITSPTSGDSVPAGVGVSITAEASHPDGVARVDIRVQGEATWPTKLDTTISQVYSGSPREVDFTTIAKIPIDAPVRSRVTITASATDVNRQPGSSSPFVVFVRNASAAEPHVTQTVAVKTEITDSIQIKATGEGIAAIGVVVRDSVGNVVKRDSVLLPAPLASNIQRGFAISLPITQQGKRVSITSFAVDQFGRAGYAVRAAQTTSAGTLADAVADSTLVVYGRTFALSRQGTIGDIAIDPVRGNVFLSNTSFNVLEVWQNFLRAFYPNGVAVGSMPWGLATSSSPDTLLVANSGGTNISRVFIGSNSVANIREDLPNRILTRNTYTFVVTQTIPTDSGVGVRLSGQGPISYSDRPQYIAQSAGGRIYYSTLPTTIAPAGTIRWLDPKLPVPDPRQVWQYGTITATTTDSYALLNVDSIAFILSIDPTKSDMIQAWDHPYGQRAGVITATDSTVPGLVAQLSALGSDAESVLRLDVSTLPSKTRPSSRERKQEVDRIRRGEYEGESGTGDHGGGFHRQLPELLLTGGLGQRLDRQRVGASLWRRARSDGAHGRLARAAILFRRGVRSVPSPVAREIRFVRQRRRDRFSPRRRRRAVARRFSARVCGGIEWGR